MPVLVIDSGHGGIDSGAVATINGKQVMEKYVAWDYSQAILKAAQSASLECYVVPHTTETTQGGARLANRVAFSNSKNATHFLCIHLDYDDSVFATGVSTWWPSTTPESEDYANRVLHTFAATEGLPARGDYPDTSNHHGRLGVLHGHNTKKVVLVETGFVSNPKDVAAIYAAMGYTAKTFVAKVLAGEL